MYLSEAERFANLLKGKRLKTVKFSDQSVVFVTEDKEYELTCEGDCCSNSWFDTLTGEEALEDAEVFSIEDVSMGEVGLEGHECVREYGLKIKTNKGYADIVMRNSSNGYYGGWINYPRE